jgi:glucosamine--fructose-6-phosphate aminotransferase (isomerizing)
MNQGRKEKSLDNRQVILETPRALRETLEKGRPEYEALIRRTRWSDGPLYIVGRGPSLPAAMTGAYGFESMVGWPVVVREARDFAAYGLGVLRPRSVLLAVSRSGESRETLEAARAARSRGATLLALTNKAESTLAGLADGVFLVRAGEEREGGGNTAVCRHAALGYISLVAAQVLKRHHPQLESLESEFKKLPGHVEWVLTQLPDAVRSFAAELKRREGLTVVGGGFFHPIAAEWARQLSRETDIHAECFAPQETESGLLRDAATGGAVVLLSNSRCRVKKAVHELAARAEKAGTKSLTITDRNDRELQERSSLAILLPTMSEMVGALLTLALLEWVTCHAAGDQRSGSSRARPASGTHSSPGPMP